MWTWELAEMGKKTSNVLLWIARLLFNLNKINVKLVKKKKKLSENELKNEFNPDIYSRLYTA